MNKFFTQVVSLIILFFFLGSYNLTAQENGGFENWEPSGSPPPFDWKSPIGWTTNNATTEFSGAAVIQSTDEHSGTLAAHLRTLNLFGTFRRAQLVLGDCALDYPNYSVLPYTGGEPLVMEPRLIRFFYKLSVGDPAEYAVADILIKRPSGNQFPDTIFYEEVRLQATNAYTEMQILIPSLEIDLQSDSIVIGFASNDTNAVALNSLLVDDVSIDFSSANNNIPEQLRLGLYPNPIHSGERLTLVHHDDVEISEIKLSMQLGIVFRKMMPTVVIKMSALFQPADCLRVYTAFCPMM